MKRHLNILFTLLFMATSLLLATGCATIKPDVSIQRDGATIVFSNASQGSSATLTVADSYEFFKHGRAEINGVSLEGPIYKKGNDYVFVTAVSRQGFIDLGGQPYEPVVGVKPLESKTQFVAAHCTLIHTDSAILGSDVVGAIVIHDLMSDNQPCGPWISLQELAKDRPALVTTFEREAKAAVSNSW